jgi:3',5'-cyclic AMP phosphodiesterase CpdA
MTRRALLAGLGVVLLVLLAVAAVVAGTRPADPPPAAAGGAYVDRDGNGVLERGPRERPVDRTELAPAVAGGREIARFAQISDAHVRDEESPARVPVLDRLGPPFGSTFRPHEALTAQVLGGAVDAVNRFSPQAVVPTGDLIDNAQANELDTALGVLTGGRARTDSGERGYDGPQRAANPDPFFYRPDVDAPRHPGLLDRAQRAVRSPGLTAPWFPVLGNHDVLVQGEVAPGARAQAVAEGDRALVELDEGLDVPRDEALASTERVEELLGSGLPGRTRRVPADRSRRHLTAEAVTARLRRASGMPAPAGAAASLDHAFDLSPRVRGVALDLVRRDEGSGGLVRPETLAFLRAELRRAGRRPVVVFSHQALDRSENGEAALALLERSPNAVAVVAGHAHRNRIRPRPGGAGGLWMIGTASVVDYPQQVRGFRLLEAPGARLVLETEMLDHTGGSLADVSRELAFVDAQGGRPGGFAGSRSDRTARLYLPARRSGRLRSAPRSPRR